MRSWYEWPEQPYYEMPFARDAYPARLAAIENAVPAAAVVLDLGCHDGRIARHLLRTGRASRVTAVDQQPLLRDEPPLLTVIRADIADLDLRALGPADVVLALNLLHHLIARSPQAARALVSTVLDISATVLIDMGSFTEQGPWQWRQELGRHWSGDEQMWTDLLAPAASRRALLRYPAMAGGTRVLWQLTGSRGTVT